MSKGYNGRAYLKDNDEEYVLYSYSCCNASLPDWRDYKDKLDGLIMIRREAFVEPYIREKKVRTKSRKSKKKRVVRRVRRNFNAEDFCINGDITVENASGTWNKRESGVDWMALNLIRLIFNEYQDTGEIPESVYWLS